MSETLVFWTGNRNPSITQTITSGGSAVDLTSKSVDFKMRNVGATAITGGTATIVSAAAGSVRYDWQAADVLTAGQRLVWWQVTSGGRTQDENEALIEFRAHTTATQPGYVELEQFKSAMTLTGTTFSDLECQAAILAASRAIDGATGRRFWLDPADTTRTYTPDSQRRLMIDDLVSVTSVKIDRSSDGVFEETWTQGTHYVLEPFNAAADLRPYESILRRTRAGYLFPAGWEQSVQVIGTFGWPVVPSGIQAATLILASKLVKRIREAPFGIVTVGGAIDGAAAVRIARHDPDVIPLISEFVRHQPFV